MCYDSCLIQRKRIYQHIFDEGSNFFNKFREIICDSLQDSLCFVASVIRDSSASAQLRLCRDRPISMTYLLYRKVNVKLVLTLVIYEFVHNLNRIMRLNYVLIFILMGT